MLENEGRLERTDPRWKSGSDLKQNLITIASQTGPRLKGISNLRVIWNFMIQKIEEKQAVAREKWRQAPHEICTRKDYS